jgi:predicted phage terminase large subunit-like protein
MNEYTGDDITRAWAVSNPLNFTRYFFMENGKKKFVVGRHHKSVCDALNDVLQGKTNKLIINIAPRYGKTELAVKNFIAMGLAINPASRFIHLSYSGTLAQDNSVAIKDIVNSEPYRHLFRTRIKYGSDTKCRWDTEQGGGVYATSTLGQITGFGAGSVDVPGEPYRFSGAIVIDDPIKPEDALSDVVRERVNRRFETTIRNRVNSRNTPIIIIMQRLHEKDLCGYLTSIEPEDWKVVSLPCVYRDENGEPQPLWPFKHTLHDLAKIKLANSFVYETQYAQNPKPLEGLMYQHFRTWQTIPIETHLPTKKCYIDTADTGADYLCGICYDEFMSGCYVRDILYTSRPMEYTEDETARMLVRNGTQICVIESNNGGRGFRRNVEKKVRALGNTTMQFVDLAQTANKDSRILTHSAEVQNIVFYPEGWDTMWPQYYGAMSAYRKEGRNEHDDAPDATTGVVEHFQGMAYEYTDEEIEQIEEEIY